MPQGRNIFGKVEQKKKSSTVRSSGFERIVYKSLKDFCKNNCAECSGFEDFIDEIERFQIKKSSKKNLSKKHCK